MEQGAGCTNSKVICAPVQVQCELFFLCDFYIYHKHVQPGELPPCATLPVATWDEKLEQNLRPVVWGKYVL